MSATAQPRLLPGDRAPWFHAAHAGSPRFASVAGRQVLLARLPPPALQRLLLLAAA